MIEFKTIGDAQRAGYYPLTRPYNERQGHLWMKVIEDMRRGDIRHCLVKVWVESARGNYTGVEVWRER
jgi:hypothetical protein